MGYWLSRIDYKYKLKLNGDTKEYIGNAIKSLLVYSDIEDIFYKEQTLYARVSICLCGTRISKRINILEGLMEDENDRR